MRTLRAEWTKLLTTPGTAWLPLAAALTTAALSAAVSAVAAPDSTSCAAGCDPARIALAGVHLGQIAVVLLAVLTVPDEYHHRLIGVTLTAAPRRAAVFAAKAVAVTAAVLPAAVLAVAGAATAGRVLLAANGFPAPDDGPFLRAAAGTVAYLVLVALLALGVAAVLRHTAAALTAVLALLYLATFLAQLVTVEPWHSWVVRYAPMSAGLAVQATTAPVGPWTGLGVLATYAAGALTLGAVRFSRDG